MSGFIHSVKVPNQYRKAAKTLQNSMENDASIKGQIFNEKHAKTNKLYAVIQKFIRNKSIIDKVIERSEILEKEPRLNKYLCYVLMTELLFGVEKLNGQSKPVQCVLSYHEKFLEILKEINSSDAQQKNGTSSTDIEKPRYVRVNTNLLSRADAIEAFNKDGWFERVLEDKSYDNFLKAMEDLADEEYLSDIHVQNLFVFPASSKNYWARNILVKESKVILQDKASCLPVTLLNPPRGSIVLDMCAAPGMKTSQLASHMKNRGTIYAVEMNLQRFNLMTKITQDANCTIVKPIKRDVLNITKDEVPNVEYILLDPPCSGSGMTNRLSLYGGFEGEVNEDNDRLYKLCGLQFKLLSHAMRDFPSAKRIVYSTCSLHQDENERIIQGALEKYKKWDLVKPLDFAEKWKNFGNPKIKHIGKKCFYARPQVDKTDGFFVAILEKYEGNNEEENNAQESMNHKWSNPADSSSYNGNYETTYEENENYGASEDHSNTIENNKKRKHSETLTDEHTVDGVEPVEKKKKKKKKNKTEDEENPDQVNVENISNNIEEDTSEEPEKKKKKKKKSKSDNMPKESEVNTEPLNTDSEIVKKKKKKSKEAN